MGALEPSFFPTPWAKAAIFLEGFWLSSKLLQLNKQVKQKV